MKFCTIDTRRVALGTWAVDVSSRTVMLFSKSLAVLAAVGSPDVLIKPDPPDGHMAGPKALLESIGP
jgi:hypothetical protein